MAKRKRKKASAHDPIRCVQAHAWYWNLRFKTGLNDYQLYLACFVPHAKKMPIYAGAARPRIFERMRTTPTPPDRQDKRRSFILIDVVEAKFPHTRDCFDHELWQLLTAPVPTLQELEDYIEILLSRTGYCRPEFYEMAQMYKRRAASIGNANVEPLHVWPSDVHDEALENLCRRDRFDDLALLTALALEARAHVREHIRFWNVFNSLTENCRVSFGTVAKRPEIVPVRTKLWDIYQARIFRNNWANDLNYQEPALENSRRVLAPMLLLKDWQSEYESIKKFGRKPKPVTPEEFAKIVPALPPWE